MLVWQEIIENTQKAYNKESFHQAISLSHDLVLRAEAKFDDIFKQNPDQAVDMVLTSYLSLGRCYVGLSDFLSVYHCFEDVSRFFNSKLHLASLTQTELAAIHAGIKRIKNRFVIFKTECKQQLGEKYCSHCCSPLLIEQMESLLSQTKPAA